MARRYDATLRSQRAAQTEGRMLAAAERLFSTEPFDRVTLAAVAELAEVTIPTVQRRFGSKEGLFAAVGSRVRARVQSQRGEPPKSDIAAAVKQLVAHYELEGTLVWHMLRQEPDVALLGPALAEGRRVHRAWVQRVFQPRDAAQTDALVAVTDLFVWKLLRIDLGRSRARVEATISKLAHAALKGT